MVRPEDPVGEIFSIVSNHPHSVSNRNAREAPFLQRRENSGYLVDNKGIGVALGAARLAEKLRDFVPCRWGESADYDISWTERFRPSFFIRLRRVLG